MNSYFKKEKNMHFLTHFYSSAAQFPLSLKTGYENILLLLQLTSHNKLEYFEYILYLKPPTAIMSLFIIKRLENRLMDL